MLPLSRPLTYNNILYFPAERPCVSPVRFIHSLQTLSDAVVDGVCVYLPRAEHAARMQARALSLEGRSRSQATGLGQGRAPSREDQGHLIAWLTPFSAHRAEGLTCIPTGRASSVDSDQSHLLFRLYAFRLTCFKKRHCRIIVLFYKALGSTLSRSCVKTGHLCWSTIISNKYL